MILYNIKFVNFTALYVFAVVEDHIGFSASRAHKLEVSVCSATESRFLEGASKIFHTLP